MEIVQEINDRLASRREKERNNLHCNVAQIALNYQEKLVMHKGTLLDWSFACLHRILCVPHP